MFDLCHQKSILVDFYGQSLLKSEERSLRNFKAEISNTIVAFKCYLLRLSSCNFFCFYLTAPFVSATSSCANLLMSQTNTDGQIKSNLLSGSYSNNLDCRWNLSSNAAIELTFLRFNTQPSADFVTVYDGGSSSSPLIGTFSGSSLPSPVQSSSRNLYVRFTSDGSGTYQGFLAHYRGMMLCKNILIRK